MSETPTLVSLFSGCGGLDIGLEEVGFRCVVANELEHYACETLRSNQTLGGLGQDEFAGWLECQFRQRTYSLAEESVRCRLARRVRSGRGTHSFLRHASVLEGDIASISSTDLQDASGVSKGELTLVAGGPPCQPFSRAGKRENVEVADGRLFVEFVRVVKDLQPRWFLFENVRGLAATKTDVLRDRCQSCGRNSIVPFEERISDYTSTDTTGESCGSCGSQDVRRYVDRCNEGSLEIIIAEFERAGYHCDWRILNSADFGVPQVRERVFILGSRDGERIRWPSPTHRRSSMQEQLFTSEQGAPLMDWRTMWDALWCNGHDTFGSLDPETAVLWVKNVVRPHDEPVTWTLDRPSPTVGAHQAAKFAIAPKGVPMEQLVRQQWHTKGRRQGDLPPVPVEHEMVTDGELLKLQSFPEWWYLFGTRMQRAFQIGNAVPPLLAKAIGNCLLGADRQEDQQPLKESVG